MGRNYQIKLSVSLLTYDQNYKHEGQSRKILRHCLCLHLFLHFHLLFLLVTMRSMRTLYFRSEVKTVFAAFAALHEWIWQHIIRHNSCVCRMSILHAGRRLPAYGGARQECLIGYLFIPFSLLKRTAFHSCGCNCSEVPGRWDQSRGFARDVTVSSVATITPHAVIYVTIVSRWKTRQMLVKLFIWKETRREFGKMCFYSSVETKEKISITL